jgi:uncharacterized membrane protein
MENLVWKIEWFKRNSVYGDPKKTDAINEQTQSLLSSKIQTSYNRNLILLYVIDMKLFVIEMKKQESRGQRYK